MGRLVERGSGDSAIAIKSGVAFPFSSRFHLIGYKHGHYYGPLYSTLSFSFWVCRIVEVKGYTIYTM
jgi:hypothetical protein